MVIGVETYEFLCDHATHGDTNDVHATLLRPADVIQELDEILRHLGSGVSQKRLATLAHAPVVESERCIFVGLGVSEILELSLPCFHETAQSHNPLHKRITISKPLRNAIKPHQDSSDRTSRNTYHNLARPVPVDFIGQFQRASATFRHIDRVFLGGLQVPVHVRVLWVGRDFCGCERSGRRLLISSGVSLCYMLSPDLAPTYAAMLEVWLGCVWLLRGLLG